VLRGHDLQSDCPERTGKLANRAGGRGGFIDRCR
jgi:hypothetical protein